MDFSVVVEPRVMAKNALFVGWKHSLLDIGGLLPLRYSELFFDAISSEIVNERN